MPKIIWKGIIKNEMEFPSVDLSSNAVPVDEPKSMSEMMIKAFPFAIPSIIICCLCLFLKTYFNREFVINPIFIPIGFVIALIGILIHELLHAVVYPKEATVEIGIIPKSFGAFAVSTYPLTKKNFVLMSLLPIVLGVIPLVLFIINPIEYKEINAILFMCAMMGLVSPYPDFFNIYNIVLKQAPKGALIQFSSNHCYWYIPQ